jgi:hypothetical protein
LPGNICMNREVFVAGCMGFNFRLVVADRSHTLSSVL